MNSELERLERMSRHWDEAMDACRRRDCAAFDRAMLKFRAAESRQEKAA